MELMQMVITVREAELIGAGVIVAVLFLWFLARLSHRPYVVTSESETMRMSVVQLNRIADSIDRLTRVIEGNTLRIEEHHADRAAEEKRDAPAFGR